MEMPAGRFSARGQSKECRHLRDIAAKLRRFGSFASEAQQAYANKLLIWSKEEPRKSVFGVEQTRSEGVQVPTLWEFMQTTGELFLGDVKLARERADTLVWVMLNGTCVGKIVACVATLSRSALARASPARSRRCCCTSNRIPLRSSAPSAASTALLSLRSRVVQPRVHRSRHRAVCAGRL